MMTAFDILRGFAFFAAALATCGGLAWLILPPIGDKLRTMTAVAGGGTLLILILVIILSHLSIKLM